MDKPCPKTEQWADIPGCPGYRASNLGRILKVKTGRILSQRRARNGAMRVEIGDSTRTVHDLVARAFHGRPVWLAGYRVKHRNGDLTDNRADNLIWSGVVIDQLPTISDDLANEYDRLERARILEQATLIDLMQT